jgi:arsenate reductase
MSDKVWSVLVLCTGNSARSILGEALLGRMGEGRIRAFSAGSKTQRRAASRRNCAILRPMAMIWQRFRSKSWDEFCQRRILPYRHCNHRLRQCSGRSLPDLHGRTCPYALGVCPIPPMSKGSEEEVDAAFARTAKLLEMRISAFSGFAARHIISPLNLRNALNIIGQMEGAA